MTITSAIKKITFCFCALTLSVAFFPSSVGAKTIYPVKELGSCRDAQECFYYCEIPANADACTAYAQRGFSKVLGDSTTVPSTAGTAVGPYTFPIVDLGNCASPQECSTFCSKTENKAVCSAFAQKNSKNVQPNASGQPVPPTQNNQQLPVASPQFLADAKVALGCDTVQSCYAVCSKVENKTKCEAFAKAEREKGVSPQAPTPPQQSGILPNGDNYASVDCTKSENKAKCSSLGGICGNFCKTNPQLCQSLPQQPPKGTPYPSAKPPGTRPSILPFPQASGRPVSSRSGSVPAPQIDPGFGNVQ
jgi:hypothetical protein